METNEGNKVALPFPLPADFDELLVKIIRGENMLSEPLLGGGDGSHGAPTKSGKGSKVSPSVQMKIVRVEAEMARLAQEVEILKIAKSDVEKCINITNQDIGSHLKHVDMIGSLQKFLTQNSTGVFEILRQMDQVLLHEHNVTSGLELE